MRILFKVTIRSAPAVNDSEVSVHHSAYQTVDNRLMIDESETIVSVEKIHSFGSVIMNSNTSASLWIHWL